MEKLNKGNRSTNVAPYNEIYQTYMRLFNSLFQSRLIGDHRTYIRIPDKENEIFEYINSGAKSVCLVTGLTGIGKSSILNYCAHKLKNEKNTHCILIDLLGRRANLDLGEDFHSLDENTARQRSEKVARSYIIDNLIGSFATGTTNKWGGYFYDYMIDHEMGHLIFPYNMHNGEEESSKITSLNKFKEKNPLAHAYAALKYYCLINKKTKVVIILDNTDQKDFELIEAFLDILSDFTRCISKEIKTVTPIISCRPYNEKRLQKRKNINSISSHGIETITIDNPCSISKIIISRYNITKKSKDIIEFNSRKGMKWTVSDIDSFIVNLTKRYEEERLDNYVIQLNNYDLSTSLKNTLNILRNRYFIQVERLLPSLIKNSSLRYGLSKSAVLKALAYGNPASIDTMYYPQDNTDMSIPNLLNWNIDIPETFLSKFRVIQYLIKRKAYIDRKGERQERIVKSLEKHLGMKLKQSVKCLKIMYYEGLIFTHSNRPPEETNKDYIVISPKARLIFEDCENHSLYTEFWFDDTPVRVMQFSSILHNFSFRRRPIELVKFILFLWSIEKEQLTNIIKVKEVRESYVQQYNNNIITSMLLNGLEISIHSYYKIDDNECEMKIISMKEEMLDICNKLNPLDICIPKLPLAENC